MTRKSQVKLMGRVFLARGTAGTMALEGKKLSMFQEQKKR